MDMRQKLAEKFRRDTQSRGQGMFGIFIAIGIGLLIVAVVLTIGSYFMYELYDEMPLPAKPNESQTAQHNITNESLKAINTAGSWLNVFTIVAIAVAIVGLIFLFAGGVTRGEVRGMSRGRGGRRRL
jgi:high-affinity Fe2+/Pb2+ permease